MSARGGTKRGRPPTSPQAPLNKRSSVIDKPECLLSRNESNAEINNPADHSLIKQSDCDCDLDSFSDSGDVDDINNSKLDNQEQATNDDSMSHYICLIKPVEPRRMLPPLLFVTESNGDVPTLALPESSNDFLLPTHQLQVLPACAVYKVLEKFSHEVVWKCVFYFFKTLIKFLVYYSR